MALVEENLAEFDRLGFEIGLFGNNTIIIRTVPDTGKKFSNPVSAVKSLIDSILDQSFFKKINMMSCFIPQHAKLQLKLMITLVIMR